MKRKIGAIFLLFLLTSPVWLVSVWTQLQINALRYEIKEKIIAGLDLSELEALAFSKKQAQEKLEWEHEYEFEYLGTMYDVVKTSENADSVYYWCWKDEEETQLNKDLEQMLALEKKNNPIQKSQKEQLVKLLKTHFIPVTYDQLEMSFPQGQLSYKPYISNFSGRSVTPPIPPPKL